MNTPSHIVYSIAGFKSTAKDSRELWLAALGGLLPDIPNYIFGIYYGVIMRVNADTVWDEYYYSDWYQPIANLSHSFVLLGALVVLGIILKRRWLWIIASSSLLHAFADFWVHAEDAYQHLYPIVDWRFISPFSYYQTIQGMGLELVLYILASYVIFKNMKSKPFKIALVLWGLLLLVGLVARIFIDIR
jgi:hypothetical protein